MPYINNVATLPPVTCIAMLYTLTKIESIHQTSSKKVQSIHIFPFRFRALGIDECSNVRCTIVCNLNNVSKNVSLDCFADKIFPLYETLTQDKEWRVRKTCADVVAEIAK